MIESAKNSEFMINEIEKNSDETRFKEKHEALNTDSRSFSNDCTEPDNTEPAGVIILLMRKKPASEEKVFFMDPGFSIPEQF